MRKNFTLIIVFISASFYLHGSPIDKFNISWMQTYMVDERSMPYLRDCRRAETDKERLECTYKELIKILEKNFECPWRDIFGEYTNIVLRFIVNTDGNTERFLTLFSDNSANKQTAAINNALIRAVYTTSGNWAPYREGGQIVPREFILPVKCNCNDIEAPKFTILDTIPALYPDGHYRLETFIEQNIEYPDGFLSKSGRQTTALLKADISKEGTLDSSSIRVLNLNSIDYRLSENAIDILLKLRHKKWQPAMVRGVGPIDYTIYFKVTYIDDKNPRRGSVPTEWDITVGNNHFYNDAISEYSNNNYAMAIELASRAVRLDPDDKDSWLLLGRAYIGAKNKEKAREAVERAIELGHENGEIWLKEVEKIDEEEIIRDDKPKDDLEKRPEQRERVRPRTRPTQRIIR